MGFLKGVLKGPKPPPPPAPAPAPLKPVKPLPQRDDPEIAKKAEKDRLASAKRRPKTNVLTSPLGATDDPNIKRKSLLGTPT